MTSVNGINYTEKSDGTLIVGDYSNSYKNAGFNGPNLLLSSFVTFGGKRRKVTEIAKCAFFDCDNIVNVFIGATIEVINDQSLRACDSITSLVFESGSRLKYIGSYAFDGAKITELVVPPSVTNIGNHAINCWKTIKLIRYCGTSQITNNIFWNPFTGTIMVSKKYPINTFGGVSVLPNLNIECGIATCYSFKCKYPFSNGILSFLSYLFGIPLLINIE